MKKIKQKVFHLPKLLWELNTNVFWLRIVHFKCKHPQFKVLEISHGIDKLPVKCSLKINICKMLIDTGHKDEDIITTHSGSMYYKQLYYHVIHEIIKVSIN